MLYTYTQSYKDANYRELINGSYNYTKYDSVKHLIAICVLCQMLPDNSR